MTEAALDTDGVKVYRDYGEQRIVVDCGCLQPESFRAVVNRMAEILHLERLRADHGEQSIVLIPRTKGNFALERCAGWARQAADLALRGSRPVLIRLDNLSAVPAPRRPARDLIIA